MQPNGGCVQAVGFGVVFVIKFQDEVVRTVVVAGVVVGLVVATGLVFWVNVVVADVTGLVVVGAVVGVTVVNSTDASTYGDVVYCVVNFVVAGGIFVQSTSSACSQNF